MSSVGDVGQGYRLSVTKQRRVRTAYSSQTSRTEYGGALGCRLVFFPSVKIAGIAKPNPAISDGGISGCVRLICPQSRATDLYHVFPSIGRTRSRRQRWSLASAEGDAVEERESGAGGRTRPKGSGLMRPASKRRGDLTESPKRCAHKPLSL
ncbi:hypothetical protein SKAU_G00391620 [Synaphobranchus kaupii]|uniref:Uncharacterized protein n=1 Tax=Synaphobranchus kaupii TaxID=118154 RepID=A0A9Q1ICU6_SYNKA|nr:hypothetical protein SKAU_G00391620 [Synaphobranchus kaupii]